MSMCFPEKEAEYRGRRGRVRGLPLCPGMRRRMQPSSPVFRLSTEVRGEGCGVSANHPHSGARVSVATAPTRERVLEFGAQSCALCEKACGAALLRVGAPSGRAYTPPLVEALRSCRRLMKINADLLRERSP